MSKVAFVFPGQGSQSVGMGKDFSGSDFFALANQILGFDLKSLCLEGPEEKLKQTEITQPAIFTVSSILYHELTRAGLRVACLAGHSLGEYSALYAAGSLSFNEAVKIVNLRGKFMQEAVPLGKGAMAAIIGLEKSTLQEICCQADCDAANYNSPEQVVISGAKESVDKALELCKAAGAKKTIPLSVSAPFHSRLMQPAADKLKEELSKIQIKNAEIPVVANVSANYVQSGAEIRNLLIQQVTSSVRWVECIETMTAGGIETFVEIGPGKVLTGLIKRINREAKLFNVEDKESLEKTIASLKG